MLNEEEAEMYTYYEGGIPDSALEYDDEEEFLKIRKEQIFTEIDYHKRKAKIVCTIG
jgi:hypothetical protein